MIPITNPSSALEGAAQSPVAPHTPTIEALSIRVEQLAQAFLQDLLQTRAELGQMKMKLRKHEEVLLDHQETILNHSHLVDPMTYSKTIGSTTHNFRFALPITQQVKDLSDALAPQ